jgi:hypothetical protein
VVGAAVVGTVETTIVVLVLDRVAEFDLGEVAHAAASTVHDASANRTTSRCMYRIDG